MSVKKLIPFLISLIIGVFIFVIGMLLVQSGILMIIFRDIPVSLCNNLGRIFELNFSKYYYSSFCSDLYNTFSAFKPLIDIVFRLGTLFIALYSSAVTYTFTKNFFKKFIEQPSYKKFILWSVKYRIKKITILLILLIVGKIIFFSELYPNSVDFKIVKREEGEFFHYEVLRRDVSCKKYQPRRSKDEIRCSAKGVLTDENGVKSDFHQKNILCDIPREIPRWSSPKNVLNPACRGARKLRILSKNEILGTKEKFIKKGYFLTVFFVLITILRKVLRKGGS